MVFVDDGSRDKTLEIVRELAKTDERVKYVALLETLAKNPR